MQPAKYKPTARFIFLLLLLVFGIFQSQAKPVTFKSKTLLEDSARAVLQRAMKPADFARLNWQKITVAYLHNLPSVLEIPDSKDTAQHLVFTYMSAMPVYHWVKYNSIGTNSAAETLSMLVLSDVQNHIFQTYRVEGMYVKANNLPRGVAALPVRVQSTEPDYWFTSLYWAFNQNPAYATLYYGVLYPLKTYGPGGQYKPKNNVPGQTEVVDIFTNPMRSIEAAFRADYTVMPADSTGNQ